MEGMRPGRAASLAVLGFLWSCNLIADSEPRHFDGTADPDAVSDRRDPPVDPSLEDAWTDPDPFDIPDLDEDGGPCLSNVHSLSAGGRHRFR